MARYHVTHPDGSISEVRRNGNESFIAAVSPAERDALKGFDEQ